MMRPFLLNPLIVSVAVLTGLMVGGIILLRSLFLFVMVSGWSMAPTLEPQDHVLVLHMWAARKIKKGSIVLLKNPAARHFSSPNATLIKRVVAVAGDVYTDPGTSVSLKSLDDQQSLNEGGQRRWRIPPGMVFVCGDHLAASQDSRVWGPVPLSSIEGVVIYRFKNERQGTGPEVYF